MDNLAAEGQGAFEKADCVFCTLGTTRGKAGSPQEFIRVGFHICSANNFREIDGQGPRQHLDFLGLLQDDKCDGMAKCFKAVPSCTAQSIEEQAGARQPASFITCSVKGSK